MKTQPTEPVEVTQADIEARRKLFDGYVIHQQSLYESAIRAFAAHRVAAERAALQRASRHPFLTDLSSVGYSCGCSAKFKGSLMDSLHQWQEHLLTITETLIAVPVPDPQTGEKG